MRVLLVNKYFHLRGGAERSLFDMDRALCERGHETAHFAMRTPHDVPSPTARHFVREVRYDEPLTVRETFTAVGRMFHSPEVRSHLRALATEFRPDIAIVHNAYHQLGPSVALELEALGVPSLMMLHDYKVVCPSYARLRDGHDCDRCAGGRFHHAALHGCGGSRARGMLLAAESYWQWRVVRSYARITAYAAPSRFAIAAIRKAGFPYEIALLRNTIAIPARASDPAAGAAVGYAGRLAPEKGLLGLLEAAAAWPEIPVRIVGEGPQAGVLQRRAAELRLRNVTFTGLLSHAETLREIASWRIAVLPSIWVENAPFGVLEAFAAGVPVVGSALGGTRELVEGRGVLVAPGDDSELAVALGSLWHDPERCRALGVRGRAFARDHCNQVELGEQLEELLDPLVAARARSAVAS